jgi:hypothetical protein
MFTNLDFIHTRICYGFLNENKYSVLLVIVHVTYEILPYVARTLAYRMNMLVMLGLFSYLIPKIP